MYIKVSVVQDFPGGSDGKASVYSVRDLGSFPGLGRFPGEGNGNPFQYSCLEKPMDRGAWCRLLSMGSQRVRHDWATSLRWFTLDFWLQLDSTSAWIPMPTPRKQNGIDTPTNIDECHILLLLCLNKDNKALLIKFVSWCSTLLKNRMEWTVVKN